MAMTKCKECGQKISSQADACPHCGMRLKRARNPKQASGCATVVVLVLFGFFIWSLIDGGSSTPPHRFDAGDALYKCQQAIKSVMVDPEKTKVPYVSRQGGGDYYFAWGRSTRFVRGRNGLGNDVPVSASCVVDILSHKITTLTVNGKSVL